MCDKDKLMIEIISIKRVNFALLLDTDITLNHYNALVPDRFRLTYDEYKLLYRIKTYRGVNL